MNHIISVTLIPTHGVNVVLDKELFLDNFIDKSEEVLDKLPVGFAIEILYDHVSTYDDGSFKDIKSLQCIVKQTSRGIFNKAITNAPIVTDMLSVNTRRAQKRALKRLFIKTVTRK